MSPVAPRFWSKVRVTPGCWLWNGRSNAAGYGVFSIGGRAWVAHRMAWTLANGPIPPRMQVCHHCDNPPCVNPDHLFLGTNKDNVEDCIRKGRRKDPLIVARGESHYKAKLTAAQVVEIRESRANGVTYRALAREYDVTVGTLWSLLTGRSWARLDAQTETA